MIKKITIQKKRHECLMSTVFLRNFFKLIIKQQFLTTDMNQNSLTPPKQKRQPIELKMHYA